MNKFAQGDIVHIEAMVESEAGDITILIVKGVGGVEQRVRASKAIVRHHERGPVKAGDAVFKKIKSGRVEGTVQFRVGDMCWVCWGQDAHSIEAVESLSR